MLLWLIGVNSLTAEKRHANKQLDSVVVNRIEVLPQTIDSVIKRFEPVTNTVTKAIQNTVVREPNL